MRYIGSFVTDTTRVTVLVNGQPAFMVSLPGDLDTLLLPVPNGAHFGLRLDNLTDALRAYPTYVGDGGDNWMNIFQESAGVLDPNLVPADGGMWEIRGHGRQVIDSFALPGHQRRPFLADSSGFGYEGRGYDHVRIYERSSFGAYNAQVSGGSATSQPGGSLGALMAMSSSGSRSAPSGSPGMAIGASYSTYDNREKTGLQYQQDARPLLTVKIVDRNTIDSPHGWSAYDAPLETINR